MSKLFPFSFKVTAKHLKSLLLVVVVYLALAVVSHVILRLLPVTGTALGVLSGIFALFQFYCLMGTLTAVLRYLGSL